MTETKETTPKKTTKKNTNNSLTLFDTTKSIDKIVSFKNLGELKEYFSILVASKRIGAKNVEEAIALYAQSQELGIGFACASNHMHIVNGKAGIDIHIVRALLSKPGTGIWWEKVEDYKPLYMVKTVDGISYDRDNIPQHCKLCETKDDFDTAKREGLTPVFQVKYNAKNLEDANGVAKPYDYRTKYKFYRRKVLPDGTFITQEEISYFSVQDAVAAGLIKDGQSGEAAWVKWRRLMVDTRAFTLGARAIGSDLLQGVYETGELYDINNISYGAAEDGTVTVLQ